MVEKIRKLCEDANMSIAELERTLGFGNGCVARWDASRPSVDKVAAVAKYFDKPIEYFLED